MKIFVTGATGFLGRHVVERLKKSEHELYYLVRKTSRVGHLEAPRAHLVYGDVADRESLPAGMAGMDWVLHMANLYSFWEPDKRAYTPINVEGTRNVLETALTSGVSKVVHVSSALAYGKPPDVPFTEASGFGPVAFSEYARTKRRADLIARDLHEQRGLPLVVVAPGSIMGPGDPKSTGQYILDIAYRRMPVRACESGPCTFVHVADAAEACVRALEKEGNTGEEYLVGGQTITIGELNRLIHEVSGVPLPRFALPDPVTVLCSYFLTALANVTRRPPPWGMSIDQVRTILRGFRFDGSKAVRELGITYTPLRQAVADTIAADREGE
jgi:dihydroflavonol-4-reductase